MILLQNPSVPTPTNPVEIDAAILDIKSELETGLIWLTNGYGRAYKNLDITNGERVYFPEIYLGKQGNSFRYTNITPDNDKTGQCFFFVRRETITEYQQGMFGFLNYDVSLIFSVNMELIQSTLIETEIYQQNLIAQVRDVLTRQILGKNYQITINNIEYLFEDVFRDFNLSEQSTIEKSPLSHFRVNLSIVLPEGCPVNSAVPTMSNLYRYDFDGVNEKLALPTNTAYNFQNTDSFSLECWIEADNTTHTGGFICKYGNTTAPSFRGWLFSLENDKIRLSLQNNGGVNGASVVSPVGSILPNTLYHVVATYNGNLDTSGIEIYINGVQQVKTIQFNNLTGDFDSTSDVSIGVISDTGLYFDGKIDNVRIRNIILTPSQVLTAYNGGTARAPIVGGLILDNRIGDGAIFGVDNWNDPDKSGTISGTQSVNMEYLNRVNS